jgi:transposase-like protein
MSDKNPLLEAMRDAARSEGQAVEFLEARRWGELPCCPRCGSVNVYKMTDAVTLERNKDFRWRCRDCAKTPKAKAMFTVRTGTVFEESRLPLWVWVHAYWRACASKKGVSAKQIERETGIAYKSALFLMDRIREGVGGSGGPTKLDGIVEADETYVGGKPRPKSKLRREAEASGAIPKTPDRKSGETDKTPVMGIVERGGRLRLRVADRVTAKSLGAALAEHVAKSASLMTDESNKFTTPGREFASHDTVNHKQKEYVRGDVTTNTIEGAFSLLKRGVYGTFHSLSRHKLPLYLREFEFRYNTRAIDDAARADAAIRSSDGKRLTLADRRARYPRAVAE